MNLRAAICALLFVSTLAVFAQVRDHAFVDMDDPHYILNNPMMEKGFGLESLELAFAGDHDPNWIPLTWLSLMLDHALYGTEPAGYLLTNAVMHAVSAILLFIALWQMTGAVYAAAFVAALFALHPLHVESVAWASERKDTLSGLFWMLTLLLYVRYVRGPSPWRYAAVLVGLALGLMSKPVVVTLPFVLLLLDYWPLGRLSGPEGTPVFAASRVRGLIVEKLPMLALVALASVITYQVQRSGGAMGSTATQIALPLRLANAAESWVMYLAASLWPANLASFYPHPLDGISLLSAWICAAALLVATGLAFEQARQRPWIVVGWLWYLGTLVPVIGLVRVGMQARADRYMYLPLIGLGLVVAWTAREWVGDRAVRFKLMGGVAVTALLACAVVSFVQVGYWRDAVTLHQRAAAVVPNNYHAYHRLGLASFAAGDSRAALGYFEESLRIESRHPAALFGAAAILANEGELERAAQYYELGLSMETHNAAALAALGRVYERQGDERRAVERYRASLRIDPDQRVTANNFAWLLSTSSDPAIRGPAEAVRAAERITRAGRSSDPALLDTLAAAYAADGRFEDAVRIAERAVELCHANGYDQLADVLSGHVAQFRAGSALVE